MQEAFTSQKFKPDTLVIIEQVNTIGASYVAQGYQMNLRQLYYQFVSRGLTENWATGVNTYRSYKRLMKVVNDGRLAGLIDWSLIQDETRDVEGDFGGWSNPGEFIDRMAGAYSEAIWQGQEYRPEVWVEKDALKAVVSRACGDTRTPVFSCRGYVSQSEMYAAAKRFQTRRRQGHIPVVIHLGDHDPSGIDMTRDIRDRLEQMSRGSVEVRRIALTMDQVEQYDPPTNPAKFTDSRAEWYVERFGESSWELDALEPSVIVDLIQTELATIIDQDEMDDRLAHEQTQVERLQVITDRWDDLDANWDDVLGVIGR